ncbi:butyrate kinase [Clostridium boliviensis]|uniref:Probable butyrate kinase n=1 Tax=Clostridium boliviensis TaxID=318465 RepID=A0ABU4GFH0_9CLOT|nr:butyrate kinase [Clostridium boliviensis]MDW2796371.1 butyrate kinase [Clostridium boliviensis]
MSTYKIFTINPGSTSTKIALFEGEMELFSKNVCHDAKSLAAFAAISDQFSYRRDMIEKLLNENGISLSGVDAVVGRGGGLLPMEGGTYEIDDLVLEHSQKGANGVQHPAMLGPRLAREFADLYQAKAYIVNPPDVDELQDLARMTGIKGVYRVIHLHALNLKEVAIRHSAHLGRAYEDCCYIVCHIGGGISVSAHRHGRMIDGFDITGGEGPMAPTRCGSISVADLLNYCEGKTLEEVKQLCTKKGGVVSHTGRSDALELSQKAQRGDPYAKILWDTMIYQIAKAIGSMAAVLHGRIDGILLGGGMVHNENLVKQITEACGWISAITSYPGEFEMEAMAAGAVRVLNQTETAKRYQGISKFQGFEFDKKGMSSVE